jgi:hypothetical protein
MKQTKGSTTMNATTKLIGRIAFAVAAVALLVGISGGLAKAQPVDIDSGPVLVARGLCVGSGGDWNITNNVFFCTYGNGHGWACDMDVSPPTCWSFFTLPTKGKISVNLGAAQIANAQVAPTSGDSSGLPINLSAVQAQIAGAQVAATSQPTPTKVKVATAGKANAAIISAP